MGARKALDKRNRIGEVAVSHNDVRDAMFRSPLDEIRDDLLDVPDEDGWHLQYRLWRYRPAPLAGQVGRGTLPILRHDERCEHTELQVCETCACCVADDLDLRRHVAR